jgi:hypothetical protein
MAEENSGKLCKASLPELHVLYYKTFQVAFLTQICDKTQTYMYSRYRKKNLCKTQFCVLHRVFISGSPQYLSGRYLKSVLCMLSKHAMAREMAKKKSEEEMGSHDFSIR